MKRWIDEVLTGDWAYGDGAALAGKRWLSAVSVGAGPEEYTPEGSRRYSVEEFLRPFERTAAFCGMEWEAPFLAYGGGYVDAPAIAASADQLLARLQMS